MNILETITKDMIDAMKNKDTFKLSVIRMAKGAIDLEKINSRKELSDEEIISILAKQVKLRKESFAEFTKAGRTELADKTEKEIEILKAYLPEELDESEIIKIIDEAFNKLNPTSMKDMGLIMKEVNGPLKGKADMSLVGSIIKKKLENL